MNGEPALRLRALLFCIAILIGLIARASGQNAAFTTRAYPIVGNTHVAADFNGDGRLDIGGSSANAVSVMLNNGDGTFRAKTDFGVGTQTQDVAAGDFNGDGKIDLVVSLNSPQVSLAVLVGNGSGSFNAPTFLPNSSGFDSPAVIATDLNNDGKLDVVLMHSIACFTAPCRSARSVTILLGNGDATFQAPREIDVNTFPHAIAVTDLNRDGIKDLAVGGENTELSILLGVSGGNFALQPVMWLVPGGDAFSACNDVDVADFNRDAIPDITVPLGNGRGNAIVLGNGDGSFRVSARILDDAISAPQSGALADYNGDGFVDIARGMGDGSRGLIQILFGNGDGSFRAPVNYAVPPPNSSVGGGFAIAADFNGDGKSDIALQVRGAAPSTEILLNTTGTSAPPAAATLSSLTLNPTSVQGGSAATGTVTLSVRAPTATSVRLSSNSAVASVPATATVPTGATSANFTISTTQVSSTASAQITATLNNASRTATLTINPSAPASDTISITRAEYDRAKASLRVEATSSRSNATLQIFVTSTGQLVGTLTNNGGGKYSGQFNWSVNPQNITVRSNFGGVKSSGVALK